MVCTDSGLKAAFAFSIISQLFFILIFVLLLLRHFEIDLVSHRILSGVLTVSIAIFLLFGIIVLAASGSDCFDIISDDLSDLSRISHSLEWGILNMLTALIVGAAVAVSIFVKKEPPFWRREKSPENPIPYVQPAQQPPPQQPPVQAQYNPQPQQPYTPPPQPPLPQQ